MGDFMEIVKNIAAIIGCCISMITLLGLIIPPIRKKIAKWIRDISEASETSMAIQKLNQKVDSLDNNINTKFNTLDNRIDKLDNDSKNTNAQILSQINGIDDRVVKIDKRVIDNEIDRLRDVIFTCGSRCRKGEIISEHEYDHLCDVYGKYHDVLHANGPGKLEFEFIVDYYNHQKSE